MAKLYIARFFILFVSRPFLTFLILNRVITMFTPICLFYCCIIMKYRWHLKLDRTIIIICVIVIVIHMLQHIDCLLRWLFWGSLHWLKRNLLFILCNRNLSWSFWINHWFSFWIVKITVLVRGFLVLDNLLLLFLWNNWRHVYSLEYLFLIRLSINDRIYFFGKILYIKVLAVFWFLNHIIRNISIIKSRLNWFNISIS